MPYQWVQYDDSYLGICGTFQICVEKTLYSCSCTQLIEFSTPLMLQLPLTFVAITSSFGPALQGPCDILGAAGNPCVAAHSTTRALYAKYAGPLYTVVHNKTNQTVDVYALKPGGFANVQQHEAICPLAGECVIARVVDQSGNGNHLAPRDDRGVPHIPRKPDKHPPKFGYLHQPVDASKHKIHVGNDSTHVYGMYFDSGMGYKNNKTTGVATGDDPETMYATIPPHFWSISCFVLFFLYPCGSGYDCNPNTEHKLTSGGTISSPAARGCLQSQH